MSTHVSTTPHAAVEAANDADGFLVLVRMWPGLARMDRYPLVLEGIDAKDVVSALIGEFKELEVDIEAAAKKAVKDDARIGMYREALARIDAACDSGSSPAQLLRRTTAATARLREGLAGLS